MALADLYRNHVVLTDSYNLGHQFQKCNVDWEVSHITNRKRGMILYGFNEIVRHTLDRVITMDMVDEANHHAERNGLPFPYEMWESVVGDLGGRIPLRVRALPDGWWCPKGTPFAEISNTEKGYGELVTWWEGRFLKAYFPSSCATRVLHMNRYLDGIARKRNNPMAMWKIHSFGFRGHRSEEDAYWAGTAWNLGLLGTDDFHTNIHTPTAPIGSIMALAHKVTQQFDDELECFKHSIDAAVSKGKKIVAMVIDTYDPWHVISEYLPEIASYAKERGVHVVLRPDSGNTRLQVKGIYDVVKDRGITNVTCIVGDEIKYENYQEYDRWLCDNGIPEDFCFFGMGGGYYETINRDWLGWAMKTCYSNRADRMKIVKTAPEKCSIPGLTSLKYDDRDDLVVHVGSDTEDERMTIYDWAKGMPRATVNALTWEEIKRNFDVQYMAQDTIKLSAELVAKMQEFSQKYDA